MSNVYAIVLAGGSGSRMNSAVPKQFLVLNGKPVIAYPLDAFDRHNEITAIIAVVNPCYKEELRSIISTYNIQKVSHIESGGETRQMSVYNALTCCPFLPDDIVLLHDAARPFVTGRIITDAIQAARLYGAANVCVETVDTILELDSSQNMLRVPPRANLRNSQTPQAFRYELIRAAHDTYISDGEKECSDDVQMVHRMGHAIAMVNGSYDNFKITTSRDLEIANLIAPNFTAY